MLFLFFYFFEIVPLFLGSENTLKNNISNHILLKITADLALSKLCILGVKFFRQLCCSKMGAKLKFQRKLSKELTRICGTIIFSFAFLLINCLDKIIHFSFLQYHARHLFVLARRLPQKKCIYVS